eukprot:1136713-Rhodomonas_salina.1
MAGHKDPHETTFTVMGALMRKRSQTSQVGQRPCPLTGSPRQPPADPDWRHDRMHLRREGHQCREKIGMEANVYVLLVGAPAGPGMHY